MSEEVIFRKPNFEDTNEIFTLIKSSPPLDVNSEYLYYLLTTHFKDSCIVAVVDNKIAGFISTYIMPECKNELFVWQVVVNSKYRGKKIAFNMLKNLLKYENLKDIDTFKTTISPSNESSKRLFYKISKELNCDIKEEIFIKKEQFLNGHEDEIMFTISKK